MRSSVVVPQIITCIVFAATTYLVYTTMVPESFFYTTVLMVGFCGISAALVQSGIFGLAGRFPPLYTQAVMSGQGIAGVIVSITSLSSVLGTPCSGNHTISLPITTSNATSSVKAESFSYLTPKSRARRRAQLQNQSILNSPVFQSSTSSSPIDHTDIVACTTRESDEEYTSLSTCTLISYIWKHALSVCLTFVVTLSVFPGITSDIRSQNNPNNIRCPTDCSRIPYGGGVWQAIFFLLFNVGDTLGRFLASLGTCIPNRLLWIVSICRVGFIPLLLLCSLNTGNGPVAPSPSSSSLTMSSSPVSTAVGYFTHDIYPITFLSLLALSNGYVASLEMMYAPNLVPKNEASRAGAIMAFFLVLGLVLGSLASFGIRAIAIN